MLFGPSSKFQRFQNDFNKHKPTDVDELFDIEYLPPIADNYWEDQSQYELGLFARGSPSGEKNFRKEELVDSVQSPERTNNVGAAALNDILSLLKPETFNWADDVEDSIEHEEEDHKNASLFFEVDSLEQSNPSGPSASLNDRFDTETLQESSRLRGIDRHLDNEQQYLPKLRGPEVAVPTPTECQLELVSSEAIKEVTRQTDLIREYPNIHHFNWLGDAVMERSYTSPEVSLLVIASPPKPLFSERLLRQAVTLWQAMKFVDPILYRGCWNDLTFSGQRLFEAITGQACQLYTSTGTWQHDIPDPDFQEPIVDFADPHFYASERGIPFNGWLSAHFAFTREEYIDQAHKILSQSPKKEANASRLEGSLFSNA